jgi:hypothetical protein
MLLGFDLEFDEASCGKANLQTGYAIAAQK